MSLIKIYFFFNKNTYKQKAVHKFHLSLQVLDLYQVSNNVVATIQYNSNSLNTWIIHCNVGLFTISTDFSEDC